MRILSLLILSLGLFFQTIAQEVNTEILSPEEMNDQPNFFLDNLEDANLPNAEGKVRLFVFKKENGEYTKEETWMNPSMVYQLYVTSTEETAKKFPLEVFTFPNLQTLVFPLWQFTEVPVYLPSNLSKLQYLDFQGAPVSKLPETFVDMKHLNSVNLTGTKVSASELEKLKKMLPKVTFF